MLIKLIFAGALLAHGAIHASFLSPRPPATEGAPEWPFEVGRSWLLTPLGMGTDLTRLLGITFVALTIAGFALAALVALQLLPVAIWAPAIVVGAIASLALLILFFHPWLIIGLVIDVVLLWGVLVAGWASPGS